MADNTPTAITLTSEISVEYIQHTGSDGMIAAAAQVSTKGLAAASDMDRTTCPLHNQYDPQSVICELCQAQRKKNDKMVGLLNYLITSRHGTPFEHGSLTVRVHAPIKVWREWHRHRVGWCVSGDSLVDFEVASTGDVRHRTMKQVFDAFSRNNTRRRLTGAALRCANAESVETTTVSGVSFSGEKQLYEVVAGNRKVSTSIDHQFLTPDGWKRLADISGKASLLCVRRVGGRTGSRPQQKPGFAEQWVPVLWSDGYEVSNHGRVRSYWRQGQKHRARTPLLKTITINNNRAVVNIAGRVMQVSILVATAFLGEIPPGLQVLHEDDNPTNNVVTNLYFGTPYDNTGDQYHNGGRCFNRVVEVPVMSIVKGKVGPTYDIGVSHPAHNFVANGFVVHNSYNEESGRYKQLEPVFYVPPRDRPMIRPEGFKSSRPAFDLATDDEYAQVLQHMEAGYRSTYLHYVAMLEMQVDRGLARDVLGVGIYSACYCTANPRSIMHFLELRTNKPNVIATRPSKPLYEIAVAAEKLEAIFAQYWPVTHRLWCDDGRMAP